MRTTEEIREHYEVELELADRLRHAPREQRARMYGQVYDELFRRVRSHPQLMRKHSTDESDDAVAERMALLKGFLCTDTVFLEIGAGDGSLSRRVAKDAAKIYALDVSKEILDIPAERNMEMVLSDGCSIPLADNTVSLAYSYQVMEHIHPDDALEQLRNIHKVLVPGGRYLCVTPNRLNGPHDVSRYFDSVARGFHLKEYTYGELGQLFRSVGFARVEAYVGLSHRYGRIPLRGLLALEATLDVLPHRLRRAIASLPGIRNLLFISLVGVK